MHYERGVATDGIKTARIRVGPIRRSGSRFEIGNIEAGPVFLFLVPPDEFLALRPWTTVRIRGGAVVHDSSISRPRVGPVWIDPSTFETRVARLRAIFSTRINAAVGPHPARGGAIVFQLIEARQQLSVR